MSAVPGRPQKGTAVQSTQVPVSAALGRPEQARIAVQSTEVLP
jgi:hypothetical protein